MNDNKREKKNRNSYKMPYNSGLFWNAGNLRGMPCGIVYQTVCLAAVHLQFMSRVLCHIINVSHGTVYEVVCVPVSCSHFDIGTAISDYKCDLF